MGLFAAKKEVGSQPRGIGTVIGADACFEGTLTTRASVCIEGTFRGQLQSEGHVVLNRNGVLEADVEAQYLSVNGSVTGNLRALKQLDVGETGVIHGDVEAASVTIAKGGVLEGTCRMISPEKDTEDRSGAPSGRFTPAEAKRLGGDEDQLPGGALLHSEECLASPET